MKAVIPSRNLLTSKGAAEAAIFWRLKWWPGKSWRAVTSESTVCSRKKRPFSPRCTKSRLPPSAKAITGQPAAKASTGAIPKGSRLGKMKARAAWRRSAS